MQTIDNQYWRTVAKLKDCAIYEAVQLTAPAQINKIQFESGDWSFRLKGEKNGYTYWGMTDQQFKKMGFEEISPVRKTKVVDRFELLCAQVDSLVEQVAELNRAMERYGLGCDGASK